MMRETFLDTPGLTNGMMHVVGAHKPPMIQNLPSTAAHSRARPVLESTDKHTSSPHKCSTASSNEKGAALHNTNAGMHAALCPPTQPTCWICVPRWPPVNHWLSSMEGITYGFSSHICE